MTDSLPTSGNNSIPIGWNNDDRLVRIGRSHQSQHQATCRGTVPRNCARWNRLHGRNGGHVRPNNSLHDALQNMGSGGCHTGALPPPDPGLMRRAGLWHRKEWTAGRDGRGQIAESNWGRPVMHQTDPSEFYFAPLFYGEFSGGQFVYWVFAADGLSSAATSPGRFPRAPSQVYRIAPRSVTSHMIPCTQRSGTPPGCAPCFLRRSQLSTAPTSIPQTGSAAMCGHSAERR